MPGPRSLTLALLAVIALTGCKSSAEPSAAADSLFVNTMADLRRIRTDPALDSTQRDSAREATLRAHGVSADELVELARELARDPGRALENWREIERLAVRDTTRGSRRLEESDSPR